MEDGKVSRFPVSCKRNLLLGFIVLHIHCRTSILPRVVHPIYIGSKQIWRIDDMQSPSFIGKKKLFEGRLKCGEKSVKSLRYQIQTLEHSRAHYYSVEQEEDCGTQVMVLNTTMNIKHVLTVQCIRTHFTFYFRYMVKLFALKQH